MTPLKAQSQAKAKLPQFIGDIADEKHRRFLRGKGGERAGYEARERDPVAPARRSDAALAKTQSRRLADGTPPLSFRGLLTHLATIVRNAGRSMVSVTAPNSSGYCARTW